MWLLIRHAPQGSVTWRKIDSDLSFHFVRDLGIARMQRIEPSFLPSPGKMDVHQIEGYLTNRPMRIFLYGFMFLFSGTVITFGSLLIVRGWRPYYFGFDIFISAAVLFSISVIVYYTHSGRKMLYGFIVLFPVMKIIDRNKELASNLFGDHLFSTFFVASIFYSSLIMLIASIQRLRDCFGVVVRLDINGVLLNYVSEDVVPWAAIDRVEEYVEYGKPAFRLHLKKEFKLKEKILWSFYDSQPTILSKSLNIDAMILRDVLSSHGREWPSS